MSREEQTPCTAMNTNTLVVKHRHRDQQTTLRSNVSRTADTKYNLDIRRMFTDTAQPLWTTTRHSCVRFKLSDKTVWRQAIRKVPLAPDDFNLQAVWLNYSVSSCKKRCAKPDNVKIVNLHNIYLATV